MRRSALTPFPALYSFRDRIEPALACKLQRRFAVAVGNVYCSRVDQKSDDLLVDRPAVAKDDGFDQCGPTEIVDVIDVDIGLEQNANGLGIAVMRRRNDRNSAI